MNELANKSRIKNISDFIRFFEKQGFEVITKGYELGKVCMEHKDGRYVELYVSGIGIDFTIKGFNFTA